MGRVERSRISAATLATVVLAMTCVGPAAAQVHLPYESPLERIVVAVPLPGPAAPGMDPAALDTALHLADPAAIAALVVRPGDPEVVEGSFRASATTDTLSIGGRHGGVLTVPLPTMLGPEPAFLVVEVLGAETTVAAHRIGDLAPVADELRLPAWRLPGPGEDAAMLDGAWWTLEEAGEDPPLVPVDPARAARLAARILRDHVQDATAVTDAALGDVTGDGRTDLVVSFRRPFTTTFLNSDDPGHDWQDAVGQSAHVGILRPKDLSAIWVAGTLLQPVAALAACDGGLAVTYDGLDDPRIVGGSAWDWNSFGFLPLAELPGPGIPACIDVDRDGDGDPAIVERS
ncbi:MAG: hypothetical protein U0869_15995 [Chloroflexota bacterium]